MVAKVNATQSAVASHMGAAHPYAPFPIARLAAAAAELGEAGYERGEVTLTQLGVSYLYRWVVEGGGGWGRKGW